VFEDTNLEEAAKAVVMGAFIDISRHSLLVLPTAEGHMN
jgi:hypothetical protein